jgi:hypothetical protein
MFIEIPFLPGGRVTHVIVDRNAPDEFLKNLEKLRITPIHSVKVRVADYAATHPDMQISHVGGNKAVCVPEAYEYYRAALTPLGFEVICGKTDLESHYPSNIAYNIARVGKYAAHKKSRTDAEILRCLEQGGVRIIDVAQGYTKCAVCVVSENAAITADGGIAKAFRANGIETLLITPGGVRLDGVDYGFIGGACGLISPSVLAFCGNAEKHRDYKSIKAFASERSVDVVSLCGGELIDIGSMIPMKQEVMDWNGSQ